MLAPWQRGSLRAFVSTDSRAAGRLRSAVAAVLMSGAFVSLPLTQVGCDSEVNKADRALRAAVQQAETKPPTKADAAPVQAIVEKAPIANPQGAVAALPVLAAYDTTKTDTISDWFKTLPTLSIGQRDAILQALKAVAVEDRKASIQALEEAAKVAGTSPEARIDPLLRIAHQEAAAGDAIAQVAAEQQVQAGHLVEDVLRLLAQIKLNTSQVAYYNTKTPAAVLAHLDAKKALIAGSAPDSVWVGEGEAIMPAGTRVEASLTKAQGELDKLNEEKKAAVAKAMGFRQNAANLTGEASKEAGEMAFNKLVEASKLNQQASLLDLDVQAIDGKIMNAQHELEIAKARQPVIEEGIKSIDVRKQQVDDRWKVVQDLIAQVQADTKRIVVGSGQAPAAAQADGAAGAPATAPATQKAYTAQDLAKLTADNYIVAKLQKLSDTVAATNEMRDRAGDQYQAAMKHLKEARELATSASLALNDQKKSLKSKAESPAYDGLLDLLDESRFAYAEAEIQSRLAALQAGRAVDTLMRADLRAQASTTLEAAAFSPVPESIATLPEQKDAQDAVKKADDTMVAAIASLDPFFSGADGAEARLFSENVETTRGRYSRAASGLLTNMLYARSRLLATAGEPSAEDKMKAAVSAANSYKRTFGSLPPYMAPEMSARLGVGPTSAPARPATLPAAATAPAPGPATEPGAEPPAQPSMFNPDGTPGTQPATTPAGGAPAPAPAPAEGAAPAPAPAPAPPPAEGTPAPAPAEGGTPAPTPPPAEGGTPAPAPAPTEGAAPAPAPAPTPPPTNDGGV